MNILQKIIVFIGGGIASVVSGYLYFFPVEHFNLTGMLVSLVVLNLSLTFFVIAKDENGSETID